MIPWSRADSFNDVRYSDFTAKLRSEPSTWRRGNSVASHTRCRDSMVATAGAAVLELLELAVSRKKGDMQK